MLNNLEGRFYHLYYTPSCNGGLLKSNLKNKVVRPE